MIDHFLGSAEENFEQYSAHCIKPLGPWSHKARQAVRLSTPPRRDVRGTELMDADARGDEFIENLGNGPGPGGATRTTGVLVQETMRDQHYATAALVARS